MQICNYNLNNFKKQKMKTKKLFSKGLATVLFLFAFAVSSKANNVQITGTTVVGSNVTFNISWDNSWNASVAPNNWDAVWVFIKYQDCNTRLWAHAGLSSLVADHSTSSPLQVDPVADGRGVFIRRSALGGGTIASTSVTLKMTIPAGTYNYKVFGIEMVNVPQGAFKIGDTTIGGAFSELDVISDGALTSGVLGGSPASANVPVAFPVGFNSMYCMKYEISQEQYADFLNSLTYDQQKAHTVTDPISVAGTYAMSPTYTGRIGIKISVSGNNNAVPAIYVCDATNGNENSIDDGQNIAMSGLNWSDLSAYLDWSALRPMSELEYEKVCRGASQPRTAGEYPWGTTDINFVAPNLVLNELKPNEKYNTAINGLCNIIFISAGSQTTFNGPLKVGFSASNTSGRASAGASYYGNMELAGNVGDMVVNTSVNGVTYTGLLGDGDLLPNGNSNVLNWPSATSGGIGTKGGAYNNYPGGFTGSGAIYARVSDRSLITSTVTSRGSIGGRGVR